MAATAAATSDREKLVFAAKISEQAKLYEEMVEAMKKVAKIGVELTVEERNLLSVAYKKVIGAKRDSWKTLSLIQQKEESRGNDQNANRIKEYRKKVESELDTICNDIMTLIDDHLIPSCGGSGEAHRLYSKMKGDYSKYMAEFKSGNDKKEVADLSLKAYEIHPSILSIHPPHHHHLNSMAATAAATSDREMLVFAAKISEQAKRHEEMVEAMKKVAKIGVELTVEERNLLSVAYKKVIGAKRTSWKTLSLIEQNQESRGNDQNANRIKEYRKKVESELDTICNDIMTVIDDHLIPSCGGSGEAHRLYSKMKRDYSKYMAEFKSGSDKKEVADLSLKAYEDEDTVEKAASTNLVADNLHSQQDTGKNAGSRGGSVTKAKVIQIKTINVNGNEFPVVQKDTIEEVKRRYELEYDRKAEIIRYGAVEENTCGYGFPYAPPDDWPKEDDKWMWLTGGVITDARFYRQRFLYVPQRFHHKRCRSTKDVERFVSVNIDNINIKKFFEMFQWQIESSKAPLTKQKQKKQKVKMIEEDELVEEEEGDASRAATSTMMIKRKPKHKIEYKEKEVHDEDESASKMANLLTALEEKDRLIFELQARLRAAEALIVAAEVSRKELHNRYLELKGNIRVFCRVRPFMENEELPSASIVSCPTTSKIVVKHNGEDQVFTFDRVFDVKATQKDVFLDVAEVVQSAFDNHNVCVFAYGQTGSGKTFTMVGQPGEPGLITSAAAYIDDYIHAQTGIGWTYTVDASVLEVYNNSRTILCPETNVSGAKLTEEVESLLEIAKHQRRVDTTDMNTQSSRSHMVLTLRIKGIRESTQLQGVLNLIDLAGSERVSSSKVTGPLLTETSAINTSLTTLNRVISALSQKQEHIPYRDSELTKILQPSLEGDSKILMIVNVSPAPSSVGETLCSLRFAKRLETCKVANLFFNDNLPKKKKKKRKSGGGRR